MINNDTGENTSSSTGSKDNSMSLDKSHNMNDDLQLASAEPNKMLGSSHDNSSINSTPKSIISNDSATSSVKTSLTSAYIPNISNTSDSYNLNEAVTINNDS